MKRSEYRQIEGEMLSRMADSAHDPGHVYRVLYLALDIARTEKDVDGDILIAACLLHDIAREAQEKDPELCHARVGGDIAHSYLRSIGWEAGRADRVRRAIRTHRYRIDEPPDSIEGKILFDADKLEAAGAMGIARTLLYGGRMGEPVYQLGADGLPLLSGDGSEPTTFLQEFNWKLRRVYASLYTARAA